jgi:predicted cupin superfamily sugar epimerase
MLESNQRSALHVIKGDELWFWLRGAPMTIVELCADGAVRETELGDDPGMAHTHVVRAGTVFGAHLGSLSRFPGSDPHHQDVPTYSLVACVVTPGFDFADFHMPSREELLARFPTAEAAAHIERLAKAG